jgi:hypothetical protein
MQITFDLPHVFYPGSSQDENSDALRILLECLIQLNRAYLRYHTAPALPRSGVVYGRTQVWDTIPAMYARGYGDCKSLTAACVAQKLEQGIECTPVHRWMPRQDDSGETDYHILVQADDGFFDPSKAHGMGKNENAYFKRDK